MTARKKRKKPPPPRSTPWLVFLFLVAASGLVWWSWPFLFPTSPQFNYLLVEKNGQPLKLLKGEGLQLNPKDRIRIAEISSNQPFNRGIRLFCSGFDVNALLYGEVPVAQLLPGNELFTIHVFKITIKHLNKDLGDLEFRIEPELEDWLEKADRIIDRTRKIEFLEKAMNTMPDNPQVREKLLEAYKEEKNWDKASGLLEKSAAEKDDERTLTDLLKLYETTSNLDGTISVLNRLVKLQPENTEYRLRLAAGLEQSGKIPEAIMAYETVLRQVKREEGTALYKTLGYLYTKTKQTSKAISSYLNAIELDPTDVNLYYNLSSLYEGEGSLDKADFFLSKALALKPDDVAGRLLLAERLVKKKDLKKAESYLLEILDKKSDSLEALGLMISIAEARQDKKGLIELYKRVLNLDRKNETILFNIGVLAYDTGDLIKSASYLEKFALTHPKDKDVHAFLFDIYKKLPKEELAYREAQTLIALDPKQPAPYAYAFEYTTKRGEYTTIVPVLEKGLTHQPDNTDLREYLVVAYLKTGKEDSALDQLKKVLTSRPKDVPLMLQMARLQDKRGKDNEALATYKKILELSPGNKEAEEAYVKLLMARGEILERQGKEVEALEVYKAVLDISPGHETAEEAYLKLRLKILPHGTEAP